MTKKPLILITNDDGITAPGLRTLIDVAKPLGRVVVVAPNSPQSGMGHAVTIDSTLHIHREHIDPDIEEYSCSGTPADCVKLAINEILDCNPDICISGINHGSNVSINVIYSGTMSAAIEAGIEDIPAVGFSLLDYSWDADFSPTKPFIKDIILRTLAEKQPMILNVNFPKGAIQGTKICRQAKAHWQEKFYKREDPQGREYYWLNGTFVAKENDQNTDVWALENGYASIVPIQYDMTDHQRIQTLKKWNNE